MLKVRGERGQATVEFAFILPVILLLIVGLIQFGKAFNYWINLNHLANEGARWAIVDKLPAYTCAGVSYPGKSAGTTPPLSAADIQAYLTCQLQNDELKSLVPPNNVILSCTPSGSTAGIGDPASVKIKAPYNLGFGPFKLNITLSGQSTMRLEQVPSWKQPLSGCV